MEEDSNKHLQQQGVNEMKIFAQIGETMAWAFSFLQFFYV
jgi:hypothetical protein